jgi:TonB family protein
VSSRGTIHLPDFGRLLKTCACRSAWLAVCALHLAQTAPVAHAQSGPPSAAFGAGALPTATVVFDIPAQSLASALETYSTTTGREILYDGRLVVGRRSTAVDGTLTPQAALSLLLQGTGLSPRSMADDALMLQAGPRPAPRELAVNTASPAAVGQYYGRIQSRLKAAFCIGGRTYPGAYHVAVSFWIAETGRVSDVELLGSTGEAARDAAVDHMLRALAIDAPPPPGFAQPVTLIIAPWSAGMTRDCQTQAAAESPSGSKP